MADAVDPRALARVGSVLGDKWTLESLLGSGGMGAVYAGRHRNGARAAVKVLHPDLARIPEVRERFLREGYAANRVDHRGAVQVLDDDTVKSGPDEGSAYLVMELLEGESLHERSLRTPKLGERELLDVIDAVLDVLSAAHTNGVVHRDLKPENIFLANDVERDGVRVKVLDFGLARISEASSVTHAGMAVGTPSFMSPEQAAGRSEEIDGRTDIFALGATVFRIVTGRRIHEADNMVQLVVMMAGMPAPPLRSITPDISETFAAIVDRALAFDRDARYPDAAAMRADVRAALDGAFRGSAASMHVIPFSARAVGPQSSPDLPAVPVTSDPQEAKFFVSEDRELDASIAIARSRVGARGPTLPWVLALLLFGLVAWKLGPSLQGELVRRASIEPAKTAAVTGSDAPPAPPASASAAPEPAASVEPSDDDDDDAGAEEVAVDAGHRVQDAGIRLATPARPHPPAAPHAAKPPAKKPPAKKRHR